MSSRITARFSIMDVLFTFVVSLLASVTAFDSIRANETLAPTDHLYSLPRESGTVGSNFVESVQKYNTIGADGDLRVNLPLFEVPGNIPVPINLSYKSGVKMDQPATWVGLGWHLGGWSVKRMPVHGDDVHAYTYNDMQSRYYVNDVYQVNIPGRSIRFMNQGSQDTPGFFPISHSNDSLYVSRDASQVSSCSGMWQYYRYNYFVMVDENATKYVFSQPLQQSSIAEPRDDFLSIDPQWDSCEYLYRNRIENNEWMLTAILSHDYVDGGGDSLNPLDCTSPREGNCGSWVAFQYTALDTLLMGPWQCGGGDAGDLDRDSTVITFLHRIVSPSVVVDFVTGELRDFKTIRYWRSGRTINDDDYRIRDRVLARMSVYEYSGDSSLTTGDELYSVVFNYEYDDLDPLKTAWHNHFNWTSQDEPWGGEERDGEPTLRSISIGNEIPYQPDVQPFVPYAREADSCGYRKKFSFDYNLELESTTVFPENVMPDSGENRVTYADYTRWIYGQDYDYHLHCGLDNDVVPYSNSCLENQAWVEDTVGLIPKSWCQRDFFGYHYQIPWGWSLSGMTTPEGLTYGYEYELDEFKIGDNHWVSGGCRVKSIIVNDSLPMCSNPWDPMSLYRDSEKEDTVQITYGTAENPGIGYATSMPNNYELYRYQYDTRSVMPYHSWYGVLWLGYQLRFQGDNVDHVIQYPRITWTLPGSGGSTEYSYLVTDSVPQHKRQTMTCYEFDGTSTYGRITHMDYAFWLDRSPLHGIPYKTVVRDAEGNEVSYDQQFYSWPQMRNVRFPANDGYGSGASSVFDCDTIAITYHLRVDSSATRRDGVESHTYYTYENGPRGRLETVRKTVNAETRITEYEYAANGTANEFDDNHYLSLMERIEKGTEGETPINVTTYTYSDGFASQNRPNQGIFYLQKTSDYNSLAPYDSLITEVLDVDRRGNPLRVMNPDSTIDGLVWSYRGLEAKFENVGLSSFAFFSGEDELDNQPGIWSIGDSYVSDSAAFSGNRALRAMHNSYPHFNLDDVSAGKYYLEAWGAGLDKFANVQTISLSSQYPGHISYGQTSGMGEWTHMACSLTVYEGDALEAEFQSTYDHEDYYDDIRLYPEGCLVTSYNYDALLRPTSVSGPDNLPVRTIYNQFGDVTAITDYNWSPVRGQEFFYKSTEGVLDDNSPNEYRLDMPNAVYTIEGLGTGFAVDFSSRQPHTSYLLDTSYQVENGKLKFVVNTFNNLEDTALAADFVVPLDTFSNGFLAFDIRDTIRHQITAPIFATDNTIHGASLWYGFENDAGNGYSCCFTYNGDFLVWRYTGGDMSAATVIHMEELREYPRGWREYYYPWDKGLQRLGLAIYEDDLYFFVNGDCIYRVTDSTVGWDSFTKVRLRSQYPKSMISTEKLIQWIDNLVFYKNPVITSEFVDASGITKQTQVFDGTEIIVSGATHTYDGRPEVSFKPIKVRPSLGYGDFAAVNDSINPFEFIDGYLGTEHMRTWEPGQPLDSNSLLYSYFVDSADAPDVLLGTLPVPYTEVSYSNDPLRRVVETRAPGLFRAYPVTQEYTTNEGVLPGFDSEAYWPGKVHKLETIDEDGNSSVSYTDGLGRAIATFTPVVDTLQVQHVPVEIEESAYAHSDSGSAGPVYTDTVEVVFPEHLLPDPQNVVVTLTASNERWSSSDTAIARCFLDDILVDSIRFFDDTTGAPYVAEKLLLFPVQAGSVLRLETQISQAWLADDRSAGASVRYTVADYDSEIDTTGIYTQIHRDFNGNDTLTVQPEGYRIRRHYSNLGWLMTDSSGEHGWNCHMYDRMGNRRFSMNETDALNGRFEYVKYDAHNRPVEIGNLYASIPNFCWPNAVDRNFPDDSLSPVVTARFEYDQGTNGRGKLTRALRYPSGSADSTSWTEYTYDERGRVTESRQHVALVDAVGTHRTIGVEYNNLDQQKRVTYNNGKYVDYQYDLAGRLFSLDDDAGLLSAQYEYWPNGQIRRKILGNPAVQEVDYKYNARDWLTSINEGTVAAANGEDHFALDLTYTTGACRGQAQYPDWEFPQGYHNGNVASYRVLVAWGTEAGDSAADLRHQKFAYDAVSRLVAEEHSTPPAFLRYWYDRNSNIDSLTTMNQQVWDYIYLENTNRLGRIEGPQTDPLTPPPIINTFYYTPEGSISEYRTDRMVMRYNLHEELSERVVPAVGKAKDTVRYWYNTGGRRVCKGYSYEETQPGNPFFGDPGGTISVTAFTGYYRLDDNMLFDYSGPNETNLIGNYVYANGQRIASFADTSHNRVTYYLNDHLGSVGATVGWDGELKSYSLYRPFGEKTAEMILAGSSDKFGYTGHELDRDIEQELYYCGARYYDPEYKIFTQVDPRAAELPSQGPYIYCANNPLKYIDPDGEFGGLAAALLAAAYIVLSTPEMANAPTEEGDHVEYTFGEKILQWGNALLGAWGITKGGATLVESSESASSQTMKQSGDLVPGPRGGTSWTTAQRRYWKAQAEENPGRFRPKDLERAKKGLAEERTSPKTGKKESKQLHHKKPQSEGGEHTYENLEELWPDEHRLVHKQMRQKKE